MLINISLRKVAHIPTHICHIVCRYAYCTLSFVTIVVDSCMAFLYLIYTTFVYENKDILILTEL